MIEAQKIYIAGPYSSVERSVRQRNVDRAIAIAVELLAKGHYPFVPHLTHYVDEWVQGVGIELSWEDYIAWDVVWLQECDALYYIAPSRGADLERDVAEYLGKPVYLSMEEVPEGNGRTRVHDDVSHLLTEVFETRRQVPIAG
jgi:nucleoside 2-deoxyribosyltransferase